jgi:hypothetical protein
VQVELAQAQPAAAVGGAAGGGGRHQVGDPQEAGDVGAGRLLAGCSYSSAGVPTGWMRPPAITASRSDGWMKTEMDAADQAAGGYSDADIVGQVPMARFAAPDDVAAAVAFLADPARSGFVNGVALPVDGGWTADAGWPALRLRKR